MKMKKILWTTDGSDEANYALKYAKYLAQMSGARITGVHVIPMPVELLFDSLRDAGDEYENWISDIEKNISSLYGKIERELAKSDIDFEGVILKGDPSEKIREYAKKQGSDIVIMGKHGHGLIESMIAGSETVKVMRKSQIPVLAVKDSTRKRTVKIKNILVPLDFYECNESALMVALDLALETEASIDVIFALNLNMYAQDIPSGALEVVIENSESHLKAQVQDIKRKYGKAAKIKNIKINTEVIHGLNPSLSITNHAKSHKTDLIVIHTHGRTGIKKFLLGSVTEKVISWSPCSVLVLNPE